MSENKQLSSVVKKRLLVLAGMISLSLGVIGLVVPLLPTTPLLLLSAACFIKGSDRLYEWLMNHKFFGEYIRNFQQYRAIPLHTKIMMIFFLWLTISISIVFVVNSIYIRILLACIAVVVTVHILHFKTMR